MATAVCLAWHGDCKSGVHISRTDLHGLAVNGAKELRADKWIVHLNEAKFPSFCWAKMGTECIACI